MSVAEALPEKHDYQAWLAHKKSRRINNRILLAAGAALLA